MTDCENARKEIDAVVLIPRELEPQLKEDTIRHLCRCTECLDYAVKQLKKQK